MKEYWRKVKQHAKALKGDGCSSSPDFFYRKCCDEHDIHYRTGKRIDGTPISRSEADTRLRECMIKTGKTPIVGKFILPWIYWGVVRLLGSKNYKG